MAPILGASPIDRIGSWRTEKNYLPEYGKYAK
jgi:hypothetical protein